MGYQIDQSGKIEQTEKTTVLACTNGGGTTIFLKSTEKRKLQKIFKEAGGNQKLFVIPTFAVLLALLIQEVKPKYKVIIDREYIGHEDLVKHKTKEYLKQLGHKDEPYILFGHVGKLSNAHKLAYITAAGKKKADIVVTSEEILRLLLGVKKTETA